MCVKFDVSVDAILGAEGKRLKQNSTRISNRRLESSKDMVGSTALFHVTAYIQDASCSLLARPHRTTARFLQPGEAVEK